MPQKYMMCPPVMYVALMRLSPQTSLPANHGLTMQQASQSSPIVAISFSINLIPNRGHLASTSSLSPFLSPFLALLQTMCEETAATLAGVSQHAAFGACKTGGGDPNPNEQTSSPAPTPASTPAIKRHSKLSASRPCRKQLLALSSLY